MSVNTITNLVHTTNLPWPFAEDQEQFQYTVNVEPARVTKKTAAGEWGANIVDLGGDEYLHIMTERRRILEADPSRVQILPGMMPACWDLLMYYLRDLSVSHPDVMHLEENGDVIRWRNDLLQTDQVFTIGDEQSLPYDPMTFLGREIPDDLLLVKDRGRAALFRRRSGHLRRCLVGDLRCRNEFQGDTQPRSTPDRGRDHLPLRAVPDAPTG